MEEADVNLWITFTREYSEDLVALDMRLDALEARSAGIIGADGTRTAVVGIMDAEFEKRRGFYHEVRGYDDKGPDRMLYEVVKAARPKRIAVNMSVDHSIADELASGMKERLVKTLREYGKRLVSSGELVVTLRACMIPEEAELERKSCSECEKILEEGQDFIRVGRTDSDIFDHLQFLARERGLELGWSEQNCPLVHIGRNIGGHLGYSEDELRDGDFLVINLGVKVKGYTCDINRAYYISKSSPPAELKRMFDTATQGNEACLEVLRAGVPGSVPDAAARKTVIKAGYPQYAHGTGHPIGREVHDIGPRLAPRWMKRYGRLGTMILRPGMVFSVEPSVKSKLGSCNLQQDALLTETGAERISHRQEELIQPG
jgi:Xaa-Pro aminopeptidase